MYTFLSLSSDHLCLPAMPHWTPFKVLTARLPWEIIKPESTLCLSLSVCLSVCSGYGYIIKKHNFSYLLENYLSTDKWCCLKLFCGTQKAKQFAQLSSSERKKTQRIKCINRHWQLQGRSGECKLELPATPRKIKEKLKWRKRGKTNRLEEKQTQSRLG